MLGTDSQRRFGNAKAIIRRCNDDGAFLTILFQTATRLLFGKCDFHGIIWSDLETLQGIFCSTSLHFIFKFHKCNIMTSWHQPDFFKTREPERKLKVFNKTEGICLMKLTTAQNQTNTQFFNTNTIIFQEVTDEWEIEKL